MFVGFVSVWLIEACATCKLPPVIPPVTMGAGHEYVVPAGTIVVAAGAPSTGLTVNVAPLHIVEVYTNKTGVGLTVTVTVKLAPTHAPAAPDVGVTV